MVGMRETHSPYRMRTANLLPKFGSSKNPFASTPKAEAVNPDRTEASVPAASAPKPVAPKTEPAKMETVSLFDSKPILPSAPAKVAEVPLAARQPAKTEPIQPKPAVAAKVAPPRKPVPWAEWVKMVNPLTYLPAREPGLKKSIRARGTRIPVQTELSLEKVKVVRNDLSDTDLEIIPAKPVGPSDGDVCVIQPMIKTETTVWNRMTSRVLGAGQTLIQ